MEFIEVEKGMRAIDLDKVESIERLSDLQTSLVTANRVHVLNLPYAAIMEIVRKRASATNQVREMIKNIDSNTQSIRS